MYISLHHRIAFDAVTEASAAAEFEKRHPDWTKIVTNTKTISFSTRTFQTYELIPEEKSFENGTEMLMPGIYIKEVK